jgi:methyl-accepting chemotaxis protein
MLDGIQENGVLIEEITKATNEQSGAIVEVTSAVKQVDEMTQHNAALVEQTYAAIEQTENQAVELDKIVEVFVVEEAPAHHAPAHRARAAAHAPSPQCPVRSRVAAAAKTYLCEGNAAIKPDEWAEF